jgi:hypothetical protein
MNIKQGEPFCNGRHDALQNKDYNIDEYEISNDRGESEHGEDLTLMVLTFLFY